MASENRDVNSSEPANAEPTGQTELFYSNGIRRFREEASGSTEDATESSSGTSAPECVIVKLLVDAGIMQKTISPLTADQSRQLKDWTDQYQDLLHSDHQAPVEEAFRRLYNAGSSHSHAPVEEAASSRRPSQFEVSEMIGRLLQLIQKRGGDPDLNKAVFDLTVYKFKHADQPEQCKEILNAIPINEFLQDEAGKTFVNRLFEYVPEGKVFAVVRNTLDSWSVDELQKLAECTPNHTEIAAVLTEKLASGPPQLPNRVSPNNIFTR
jgi:hypothetical protein